MIFFYYIKKFKSFFLIYFFFSGASLLLVERGNNDLIIFLILFFVTFLNSKLIKYFLFFLATALKLYPVFGVLYFLKNKKNYKNVFIVCVISIIYFTISYNDIIYLVLNTPKTGDYSFGSLAIKLNIFKHSGYSINQYVISFFLLISTLATYLKFFYKKIFDESFFQENVYLLGSVIYLSIFLIGSHFDYRLFVLFFTVPTLIKLNNNFLKYLTLTSIILSLELHRLIFLFGFFGGLINVSAKFILFIILGCLSIEILLRKIKISDKK